MSVPLWQFVVVCGSFLVMAGANGLLLLANHRLRRALAKLLAANEALRARFGWYGVEAGR